MANRLLGGTSAVVAELAPLWPILPRHATLLDVGTGLGDIPARARAVAARHGVQLTAIGLDARPALAAAARERVDAAVCGDARALPFADASVDVVMCSQVLHHFFDADVGHVLRELDRVARRRVIVSDLRRSHVAAVAFWVASFALAFHPVSRHDGLVSVMRGFRASELGALARSALDREVRVASHRGYRLAVTWMPDQHRSMPA